MELREEDLRILRRVCVRRLGAAGEDAAQRAAIAIVRRGRPLPDAPGERESVLRWHARNAITLECEAWHRWILQEEAARTLQVMRHAPSEEEARDRAEQHAIHEAALAHLPPDALEVLAAWDERRLERLAAEKGTAVGTVYTQARLARRMLCAEVRRAQLRANPPRLAPLRRR